MLQSVSTSEKYLRIAHAGAVVLIGAVAAYAFDAPDFLKGLPLGMLLALIILLFRSQMRDEYIERLWNAGTAAAFLTALVGTLGIELVRGFADQSADVFSTPPVLSPLAVGGLTLAAFFLAFHARMWRTRS